MDQFAARLKVDLGFVLGCFLVCRTMGFIGLIRRQYPVLRVWAVSVILGQPFSDAFPCFRAGFKGGWVNAFVFQGTPQPFDHAVVDPSAFAMHRDFGRGLGQRS